MESTASRRRLQPGQGRGKSRPHRGGGLPDGTQTEPPEAKVSLTRTPLASATAKAQALASEREIHGRARVRWRFGAAWLRFRIMRELEASAPDAARLAIAEHVPALRDRGGVSRAEYEGSLLERACALAARVLGRREPAADSGKRLAWLRRLIDLDLAVVAQAALEQWARRSDDTKLRMLELVRLERLASDAPNDLRVLDVLGFAVGLMMVPYSGAREWSRERSEVHDWTCRWHAQHLDRFEAISKSTGILLDPHYRLADRDSFLRDLHAVREAITAATRDVVKKDRAAQPPVMQPPVAAEQQRQREAPLPRGLTTLQVEARNLGMTHSGMKSRVRCHNKKHLESELKVMGTQPVTGHQLYRRADLEATNVLAPPHNRGQL